MESGQYREAHRHLVALEADAATPENLATLGQQLRARIEREAGRLRIERSPDLSDTEVVLDTVPVEPALLDTLIPVRTGEHHVVATRGARMVASADVAATAGQVTDVLLEGEPEAPPPPPSTSIVEEPAFWLVIGGGVLVVAGVIIVTAVLASDAGASPVPGDFSPAFISWP